MPVRFRFSHRPYSRLDSRVRSWEGCVLDRYLHFDLSAWRCKRMLLSLACAFIFGLISGVLISMSASGALDSTMRAAPFSCVSISGLLSAILLPFLLSAFAVYLSCPWLLLPIAFCKAFLITFLGLGVLDAFGSAGWLIRFLLMFGDVITLPLLWWYLYQVILRPASRVRCTLVAAVFSLAVGGLDHYVISPFLANLIS